MGETERDVDTAIKLDGKKIPGREQKFQLSYGDPKGKGKGKKGKEREQKPKPPGCTKVAVFGLSPEVTEEHLLTLFEQIGTVKDCHLMRDRETGDSRCCGFVDYGNTDHVDEAKKLSGELLCGQALFVD